ncbi:extracellular solute-binding protein [Shimia sp. R11_0]|uniref:ABC transporter substrate-binding protein n=1 Tax=Shimia sp. R11_0 TaxID=2821096 RepID=UPI001AD95268|nr:extracellular solute-binding protein [Shimia sp. R11_0]MBO9477903.1 extracellular solute-binding protein [Shimia sp. R11_0]
MSVMKSLPVKALLLAGLTAGPVLAEDVTVSVWSRADKAGPLRPGNIVEAAETLNGMLSAAGSDKRVVVELIETSAKGFDADALDLLKAHSVGQGPDIAIAAHEWIGAFVEAGFAANLEDHITSNDALYGDIIPGLWNSVSYKGARYGVPQDSEVRMIFLNNDILRAMGKTDDFIATLPQKVDAGDFTMFDLCDLSAEAVSGGHAEFGLLHRPNVGPDFQMAMESFGVDIYNEEEAKLQMTRSGLEKFYGWLNYCVDKGALPGDMTSWTWASTHEAFRSGKALAKHHGIWNVGKQIKAFGIDATAEAYFDKLTWINAPAGEQGGSPANLSHPIAYVVADGAKADVSAMLVALASQHVPNTNHAVTTNHTPINYGQSAMPAFQKDGWALIAGIPLLEKAGYMPNHAKIGQFNALTYQGIQAVETGEMSAAEAAEFVIEELEAELGDDVIILD